MFLIKSRSTMGRLASNQILPMEKADGTSPSPSLSWPPSNKRRGSPVFGGHFQKFRMKRRLKFASGGAHNQRRIWEQLGSRIQKPGPAVSRDYQSLW